MFGVLDKFVVDANGRVGIGTIQPLASLDLSQRTDGIILPRTNVISNPLPGMMYIDTSFNSLRIYTNQWVQYDVDTPYITSVNTSNLPNTNSQMLIMGSNFEANQHWILIGSNGTKYYPTVAFNSPSMVTLTRPSVLPQQLVPYKLLIHSVKTGLDYISPSIEITVGVNPTFITSAGSLGNFQVGQNITSNIEATDEVGGGIGNMSVTSGSLPSGVSLSHTNGILDISGTVTGVYVSTTYNFTITATDLGNNTVSRSFSLVVSPLYPNNPWAVLEASNLSLSSGANVSSWGEVRTFTQATTANQPTYFSTGGFSNKPYVFFNRTNSTFLNAGTQTLNVSTNGGFTMMVQVKYTGTAANFERIIDFGNGQASDNIIFARYGTTQNIEANFYVGSTLYENVVTTTTPIVQDEWAIYTFRYIKQSKLQIYKNNTLIKETTMSRDYANRTLTNTYIGRANWADPYLNAQISKLFIYDRNLTDNEMSSLYYYMLGQPVFTSSQPSNISINTNTSGSTITYAFTAISSGGNIVWSITPTTYGTINNSGNLTLTFPQGTTTSGTFTVTATDNNGSATQSWNYNIINEPDLFFFTAHTFTNATATGRSGPTLAQIRTAYSSQSWVNNTSYLNMSTQGIQIWTVPKIGVYTIVGGGASGGPIGGTGNIVSAKVTLTLNDKLYIVVGQLSDISVENSAGGGGTFVYLNDISSGTLLLAAGGGGGNNTSWTQPYSNNINANTGTNGLSGGGNTPGSGGTNGGGGGGGTMLSRTGTAGSNGTGGNQGGYQSGGGGGGGMGMNNSATFLGGTGWLNGGFGGGGGTSQVGGCGGGGGYSGGGGGGETNTSSRNVGGGGGSYASASVTNYNNSVGTNNSHGFVTITTGNEYPPIALSSAVTNNAPATITVSGQFYGNGDYVVKASATLDTSNWPPWKAFNKTLKTYDVLYDAWVSDVQYSTTSPYAALGSAPLTTVSGSQVQGAWMEIKMPSAIILTSYLLAPRNRYPDEAPTVWVIAGSQDGTTWYTVNSQSSQTTWPLYGNIYTFTNSTQYTYYRIIIQNTNGTSSGYTSIGEWRLFNDVYALQPVITSSQPSNININTNTSGSTFTYTFTATSSGGDIVWSITPTTYGNIDGSGNLTLTFPQGTTASGTFTVTATDDNSYTTQTWNYNIVNLVELFLFTTHTFTNATATGSNGPTLAQIQSAYSSQTWASDTSYLNMTTQGIQIWTVPKTGTYALTVAGAKGGNQNYYVNFGIGNGRTISGNVSLTVGDKLYIVVGHIGVTGYTEGGGGGGTFVYLNDISSNTLLLAAGGGGGSGNSYDPANVNGNTNTNGLQGYNGYLGSGGGFMGGTNGGGGLGGSNGSNGTGGAGNSSGSGGGGGMGMNSSATFIGGGSNGGFGGGGGRYNNAGGGGGGYSGGGGSTGGSGGGGGSYGAPSVTNYNNNVGTNTSNGYVTITIQ